MADLSRPGVRAGSRPAVLAVDGGNFKTDVALVAADGRLLALVRGPTISHQAVGIEEGMARLGLLVGEAERLAHLPDDGAGNVAAVAMLCLAGADFPADVRLLGRGVRVLHLAPRVEILNDCFAALRAGADRGWGIVLICGQGINGAGVAPDGRRVRFAGIGTLSGDWGGGGGLGQAALGAAIRAGDGRGPRTTLRASVAAHFGMRRPEQVMLAMYEGRLSEARLAELAPVVFADAGAGDRVARSIVDRLADELGVMAAALVRRIGAVRQEVDVVLAGGVFSTSDTAFHERLQRDVLAAAPRARVRRLEVPAVVGAALLGLDRLATQGRAGAAADRRLRSDIQRQQSRAHC